MDGIVVSISEGEGCIEIKRLSEEEGGHEEVILSIKSQDAYRLTEKLMAAARFLEVSLR